MIILQPKSDLPIDVIKKDTSELLSQIKSNKEIVIIPYKYKIVEIYHDYNTAAEKPIEAESTIDVINHPGITARAEKEFLNDLLFLNYRQGRI